jgi:hypothetical protein
MASGMSIVRFKVMLGLNSFRVSVSGRILVRVKFSVRAITRARARVGLGIGLFLGLV